MINKQNGKMLYSAIATVAVVAVVYFLFFARESAPDFSQYEAGPERKEAFFSYFHPIVNEINEEIRSDRATVVETCDATGEESALSPLAEKYRVDDSDLKNESLCDLLLRRVDVIPASLALAQAANESAWGTSRFAKQGNNFFGQWCFEKGCGIVPNNRDANKTHEVADFRSPSDSVKSYMLNLNGHDAYRPLREIRESLRMRDAQITGIELSHGLNKYSERGEEYGEELRAMIRFNELTRFDTAS
ncbi:glucosaminidase domain-containing protein [Aestuariibacter salexigens]|uniref:glucosaminidase domain-containing protein n=1 Tax=Aestuariibacter salexigens TaxID=226010 RepID=UPI0004052402|nr:glucosaminidase domain-containing protein [Aestuariibacter salexigens]